jgi:hypothetical protein
MDEKLKRAPVEQFRAQQKFLLNRLLPQAGEGVQIRRGQVFRALDR